MRYKGGSTDHGKLRNITIGRLNVDSRRLTVEAFVAATCAYTRAIDRSSRAGYRSILVLTSLANRRADQSERRLPPVPIRTPEG